MKTNFYIFILILIIFNYLTSCSGNKTEYHHEEGIAWNTSYHISYESEADLSDSIIKILNSIDKSLSPFNDNSIVSKINKNQSFNVDTHFSKVYNKSKEINSLSNGNFDPTLGPIIRAWGFGEGHIPSEDTARIDYLLKKVGIEKTELKKSEIYKLDPEIEFNFSALAKGYGVDCIAEMLERNGVNNYLVEVGGEIRAKGYNSNGCEWMIGIDAPSENVTQGNPAVIITANNCGIATSGNYRNYHTSGSTKFGHTISPKTGRPVKTDVISATVIAETCMTADALATCCMVMGSQDAINLCDSVKVGVLLILSDNSFITNPLFPDPKLTD